MHTHQDAQRNRPNSHRLQRLTTLRKARKLTLDDMAAACGLTGSQRHQTAGSWERGRHRPDETERRGAFIAYLWDTLGLAADPDEFHSIWAILVEEWGWAPLTPAELAALEPDHAPAAMPPALAVAPTKVSHWVWGLGATLSLALLFLLANALTRPPVSLALRNFSFEDAAGWSPWRLDGDPSCAGIVEEPAFAAHGSRFLQIANGRTDCPSLRHDLDLTLDPGVTVRFAIWARSREPVVQQVDIALSAGRTTWIPHLPWLTADADSRVFQTQSTRRYVLDATRWQCMEVALTAPEGGLNRVRAEVTLPNHFATQLALDDATLTVAGTSLCDQTMPHVVDAGFEQSVQGPAWQASPTGCTPTVVAGSGQAWEGDAYLAIADASCNAVTYDLDARPLEGVAYRARAWVRVAGTHSSRATLALRALHMDSGRHVVERRAVNLHPGIWRCVETVLPVSDGRYDRLRLEVYLDVPGSEIHLDDVAISAGAVALCPRQELLVNPSFEEETGASPWATIDECPLSMVADPFAPDGARVVRIEKGGRCHSFYQDVQDPSPDATLRTFSLWMRTEANQRARGRLALWHAGNSPLNNTSPFVLHGDVWHCQEVTLQIANAGSRSDPTPWRVEVYFESDDAVYYLDHASLVSGATGECPHIDYAVTDAALVADGPYVPGAVVSSRVRIENKGIIDQAAPHQLYYWLAESRQGPPIHADSFGTVTIPPLAAGATSSPLYFDVNVPLGAAAERDYVIPFSFTPPPATGARLSELAGYLPVTLVPCAIGSLFCDVAEGSWGEAEATAVYAAGITTGCRSAAQPYHNLPLCADQLLWPTTLAIFIGRHEHGVDFQPSAPYQGRYADIPANHPRALWIESFGEWFVDDARPRCTPEGQQPRFCPDLPITRGELLWTVAKIAGLSPDEPPAVFADISDPRLAALADAAYAMGIVPIDDPSCPALDGQLRLCPDEPALRLHAAVWLARAYGLVEVRAADVPLLQQQE